MSEKLPLGAYHILDFSGYYWFAANEFNGVFQIHKQTKKVEFLETIPQEDFQKKNLISKLIRYRNKIVFVPLNAKRIWIKDIESGSWKSIELKEGEHIKNKFFQAIQYRNKIYMIGCRYPSIVCLDMEKESIVYLNDVMKKIDENCRNDEKMYFRNNYVQIGTYLYLASCKTNYILKLDMSSDKFQLIRLGAAGQRYSGITWDGEEFWLSPRHGGKVTIWDEKDNQNLKFLDFPVGDEGDFIRGIVFDKNRVFLLADRVTFSVAADNWKEIERSRESFWFYEASDKVFYLKRNGIFQVCKDSREEFKTTLEIDKEKLRELLTRHPFSVNTGFSVLEDGYFDLSDYLNLVESKTYEAIEENRQMGEKIWSRLRSE